MDHFKQKYKIAGSVNLIAGFWLILSSFAMGFGLASNLFVVGLLVAIISLIEVRGQGYKWANWANGILGLWLVISPLIFTGMLLRETWNSLVMGVIIFVIAAWSQMTSKTGIGHPGERPKL